MDLSPCQRLSWENSITTYKFVLFVLFFFFSHRLVAEESDSDSDEDLEGGVRHDLMMADEKVNVKTKWVAPTSHLLSQSSLLVMEHRSSTRAHRLTRLTTSSAILVHLQVIGSPMREYPISHI